ncbi:MAG: hypothetical protein MJA83_19670 [Gammaproteobacteria bacterium]|nr:hypothetical protein [Gammaproteobacteria bacterium]
MKYVIVKYKVKSDRADENVAYIKAVFKELEETAPEHIRYASFQQEDRLSFIHIAFIDDDDAPNPLASITAFHEFAKDIKSRCAEPPLATKAKLLGAYNLFG